MPMGSDAVVLLPSFLAGIHVDYNHVEVAQLMQELVVDLPGYRVPLRHRELRRHGNVDLSTQPVPQPPRPYFRHIFHPRNMSRRVANLLYHLWIYSV